jgi:perosamine synthetase
MKLMKKRLKLRIKKFIPVNAPLVTNQDALELYKAAKSGWISSSGRKINEFEKKFASFIGVNYATTVSNGTAALEIAIKALDIKKNDEVIIPNFTIISNALAVIKQNAKPIFVDCEKYNWNMKIEDIEKKITKRTKAIIATHIYNYPLEIKKIKKLCKSKKIYLIEDAAESLGNKIDNKLCGSFGDISIFSFYANKHITTGEGGMITTNNLKHLDRCKALKNLCFGKKDRFHHEDIGWNYRFTNLQASLGLSQLSRIKKIIKKKKSIGKYYYDLLKKNKNIFIPAPKYKKLINIYWVVGILIKENLKIDAKNLSKQLLLHNIETRPFFWPMNEQKILKKLGYTNKNEKFKNSDHIAKYGLYLPSGLTLEKKQIKDICEVVNSITN